MGTDAQCVASCRGAVDEAEVAASVERVRDVLIASADEQFLAQRVDARCTRTCSEGTGFMAE